MPAPIAIVLALVLVIPIFKKVANILGKFVPLDESSAISESEFIGKVAIICQGAASLGNPAQARLKDRFGQWHYIILEPDVKGLVAKRGEELIITHKIGSVFTGTKKDF